MRNRKGSMRIIEAFIACGLILIGHTIVSRYTVSTHKVRDVELEAMGQNLLNTMEDHELFTGAMTGDDDWAASLKQLVEAILPPGVLYNISIDSLIEGGSLNETITNMGSDDDISSQDVATVQGTYTFSYPLVQMEDVLLDIIMVIDRSGSMNNPIQGDPHNKMYYAKEAASNFIDRLNSTTDRSGLASFATESSLDASLTHDLDYVKQQVNGLSAGGWTNIGGGISESNSDFEDNGRYNATWVMILLSDGKTNRPTNEIIAREYALEQSQDAQDMGVWVYTIGLGNKDDIDEELLKEIQTHGYFYAPSAGDLEDIYQAIAEDLIFEVKYDVVLIKITLMVP